MELADKAGGGVSVYTAGEDSEGVGVGVWPI